jgi:hypothetical protein
MVVDGWYNRKSMACHIGNGYAHYGFDQYSIKASTEPKQMYAAIPSFGASPLLLATSSIASSSSSSYHDASTLSCTSLVIAIGIDGVERKFVKPVTTFAFFFPCSEV